MKKIIPFLLLAVLFIAGCKQDQYHEPKSASGVTKAVATVAVGSNGLTVEQTNVKRRVEEDNKPGAVKHLYVIAPESGQVIIYSTVAGKVTSSGKRLTPKTIAVGAVSSGHGRLDGFEVNIGGKIHETSEVLEDDGTYGSSEPYIYWWDTRGVYHQHFFTGGQIIHVSDQPLAVGRVALNLDLVPPQEK